MKKLVVISSIILSLVLTLLVAFPVSASISVVGVTENFSATYNSNTPALTIQWEREQSNQKPDLVFRGTDFYYHQAIKTIADIENYIQTTVYDPMINIVPLAQLDPTDRQRQNPPVLYPGEVIIGNKLYTYGFWFAVHIYTLDDPATSQSELRFVTRFWNVQDYPNGIPPNWW